MESPLYGRYLGNYLRYYNGLVCVVQQMYPAGHIVTVRPLATPPCYCELATEEQFEAALAQATALLDTNTPPCLLAT